MLIPADIILIDSHVHIHKDFSIVNLLESALINFTKYSSKITNNKFTGVLCLTESERIENFLLLERYAAKGGKLSDKWEINLTNESNSLKISFNNQINIFIIAGRQIVTKENLEVLALGKTGLISDGEPINFILELLNKDDCLPVIPWGFGKWTRKRKEIVKNLIKANNNYRLFLGDNGNRPFFLEKSGLIKEGEIKGIFNLPGSDPLPFKSEVSKPGSFGFIIEGRLDQNRPFNDLRCKILNTNKQFRTYGKLETPVRFFRNQLLMQIIKHKKKLKK